MGILESEYVFRAGCRVAALLEAHHLNHAEFLGRETIERKLNRELPDFVLRYVTEFKETTSATRRQNGQERTCEKTLYTYVLTGETPSNDKHVCVHHHETEEREMVRRERLHKIFRMVVCVQDKVYPGHHGNLKHHVEISDTVELKSAPPQLPERRESELT